MGLRHQGGRNHGRSQKNREFSSLNTTLGNAKTPEEMLLFAQKAGGAGGGGVNTTTTLMETKGRKTSVAKKGVFTLR